MDVGAVESNDKKSNINIVQRTDSQSSSSELATKISNKNLKDNDSNDDNWQVLSSDEEGDTDTIWEPSPEKIIELYAKINEGKLPQLKWTCPERREPSIDGDDDDDEEEDQEAEAELAEPTAFDFDSMFSEPSQPIGQRKTKGTLKVQQKRVASLDKILKDMQKDPSVFQVQSPRVPFQSMSKGKLSPAVNLFEQEIILAKDETLSGSGIPLPSAYTLTSPQASKLLNRIIPGTPAKNFSSDQTDALNLTPGQPVSVTTKTETITREIASSEN